MSFFTLSFRVKNLFWTFRLRVWAFFNEVIPSVNWNSFTPKILSGFIWLNLSYLPLIIMQNWKHYVQTVSLYLSTKSCLRIRTTEINNKNRLTNIQTGLKNEKLKQARTCYDHLAGELRIKLFGSLVNKSWFYRFLYKRQQVGLRKWGHIRYFATHRISLVHKATPFELLISYINYRVQLKLSLPSK